MNFMGGCHCKSIEIEFRTDREPSDIEVRACQCSFCKKHNSRALADPHGLIVVRTDDRSKASFYEFGLRTARFLVCGRCGVYVAATTMDKPWRALAVLNALDLREQFSGPALPVEYDAESRKERILRRQLTWTPAVITDVHR